MLLPNFPKIENLPCGPHSSLEEIEALKARVLTLEPKVIFFKELCVHSPFQLDLMFDRVKELTRHLKEWYLIVDLTEAGQPSAEIRAHIRQKVLALENPKLIALVIGGNTLASIASRFIIGNSIKMPYVVVKTVEHGLQKIRDDIKAGDDAN